MDFLSNLWNSLKGFVSGKQDNSQSSTSQVSAPRNSTPIPVAPAQSQASLTVAPQTSQLSEQKNTSINPVSALSPVSLMKFGSQNPVPINTNDPIPVTGAAPSFSQPEPGLLQKVGNFAEGIGKGIAAPFVGAAHEIAAPFEAGIYNDANNTNKAQDDALNAQLLAAARKTTDPAEKAKLLSLYNQPLQKLDTNDIAGINDTPEQVLGNFAGVGLTALTPGIEGLFPEASALGKIGLNTAIGGGFGASSAASNNVTDPTEFAKQTAIGAGSGGLLSGLFSGLGKLSSIFRGAPDVAEAAPELAAEEAKVPTNAPINPNAPVDSVSAPPVQPEPPVVAPQQPVDAISTQAPISSIAPENLVKRVDAIQPQASPQNLVQDISQPSVQAAPEGVPSVQPVVNDVTSPQAQQVAQPAPVTSEEPITIYHGDGNMRPGGAGQDLMGPGKYFSPDESVAREFGGNVSSTQVKPSEIFTIKNQGELNGLLAEAAKTYPGDPMQNLPKLIADKGFKAIQANPDEFGSEAGINMISPEVAKPEVAPPVSTPVAAETPKVEAPITQSPTANPEKAESAPRLRDTITSQMRDTVNVPDSNPEHDVLVLKDLTNQAQANIAKISDSDLTNMYINKFDPKTGISNPQQFALANASLDKLYELGQRGDESAATAAENALQAMQQYSSKNAQYLSATRVAYDNMPLPMKIDRGITQITNRVKAIFGDDSTELNALKDPAQQSAIKDQLGLFFKNDKAINDQLAVVQNEVENMKANPSVVTDAQIKDVESRFNNLTDQQSANTEKVAQYIDQIAPAKKTIGDTIADVPRASMLSGAAGRVRHVVSAGINTADEVASSKLSGVVGGVLNKLSGTPGKFVDSGVGASDVLGALPDSVQGIKDSYAGTSRFQDLNDLDSALKSNVAQPLSDTNKSAITRGINTAVSAPSKLTEGVAAGNVRMLAQQEGEKLGFTGDALDNYTKVASISPSKEILDKANLANETVNNLNADNPISKILSNVQKGIAQIPVIGPTASKLIVPFPTFTGANFWNAVTDRNLIGNIGSAIAAGVKGDQQEVVNQLSKAVVHGTEAGAAGYILAQSGLLTTTDANGKSYDGLYLHLGSRFVPVGFLGALAPNIIQGFAAYNAYKEHSDGTGILQSMADQTGSILKAAANSFGASSLTGADSPLLSAVTDAGKDPSKAAADVITGTAGGVIPAGFSDINSVLNQTGLNPTHEAADTTVTDPNSASGTAKDYIGSAIQSLKNRIPFESQTLPRIPGQASQDFLDKVSQGNHTSDAQAQAATEAASTASDQVKSLKDQGVFNSNIRAILDPAGQKIYDATQKSGAISPADYKNLVADITKNVSTTGDTAFLSKGDYAGNLTALNLKLADLKADPTTPQKTLDAYQAQINRGTVYQKNQVPYSLIEKYADTTLTAWRNMGDPNKSTYDPKAYQDLYNLDQQLAAAGGTKTTDTAGGSTTPAFTAKAAATGSASSASKAAADALKKIQGNKIGTLATILSPSLQKIAGHSTGVTTIPTVPLIKSSALAKHAISVKAGV